MTLNESATAYEVKLKPAGERSAAELIFSLTRTSIVSAQLLVAGDPPKTLKPGPGPYLQVPFKVTGPITIMLMAEGEPLQGLYVKWHHTGYVVPTNLPQCTNEWTLHLERRALISQMNECQKFFFELDRRSLADLVHCHDQVQDGEKRLAHVTGVDDVLVTRIATRWAAKGVARPELDLAPIGRDSAADIIRGVFMKAAEDVRDIKRAFIRFAAGWESVTFPGLHPELPQVVTEPNGWKIFMFAEFALAVLEVFDHECDAEARFCAMMLPTFVAIQRIYVERRMAQEPKPRSFCEFGTSGGQHPQKLVRAITEECDRRIVARPLDVPAVNEAIRENLLGTKCDDFRPRFSKSIKPVATSDDDPT